MYILPLNRFVFTLYCSTDTDWSELLGHSRGISLQQSFHLSVNFLEVFMIVFFIVSRYNVDCPTVVNVYIKTVFRKGATMKMLRYQISELINKDNKICIRLIP